MPSQAQRREVLNEIADSQLAERAAAAEAKQRARDDAIAEKLRREEQREKAEVARKDYVGGAVRFEAGAREMVEGIKAMLVASTPLLLLPNSHIVVSKRAILARASHWLVSQLYSAAKAGDFFGHLRLNFTGRPGPNDGFANHETNAVGRLFVQKGES